MEDVFNRIDFRICKNACEYKKLASSPYFKRDTIFSNDVMGVHMLKHSVKFDKPIYCGAAILDLVNG
jgi:hypothetical protein